MDAVSTTFKEALFGRKYRKGTWICLGIMMFDQQSGINAINIYANQLLVQIEKQGDEDFPLTPIQGTYLIGLANFIASTLPLLYIHRVGRKPIFVTGFLAMALAMFFCGLSVYYQWNVSTFVMIIVLIFAFHMSTGGLTWVYVPEVCVDTATGVGIAV
mmetsp:Transcript_11546/g.13759  ORF Transcript_11546/g.13759 Transcript_11546/m.13759 type:complete len:158 (-) Transcript_11546:115-588(-)